MKTEKMHSHLPASINFRHSVALCKSWFCIWAETVEGQDSWKPLCSIADAQNEN